MAEGVPAAMVFKVTEIVDQWMNVCILAHDRE
jgi:hypothetical protein